MGNDGKGGLPSGQPATSESKPPHEALGDDFAAQDRTGPGQAPPHVEKDKRLFHAATGQPVIRWRAGELPEIVDQAETALMESGLQIFQRDSPMTVVRVVRRQASSVRNYKRPPGVLGLVTVESHYLGETLTRCAFWEKFNGKEKAWVRTNCPEEVVSKYLARGGEWKLPRLAGAISSPTLRPDGTILQTPGYDEAMRVFYDPCGVEFPEIPESPTEDDAADALAVLKEAFASFPYKEDVDQATALAAALTGLVRRSLPAAPLIGISAPMPGTGKTLLADGIAILAMGTRAPAMAFAKTDEEAQKTALSVLMQGDPVVLIDNIERPLEGDWLCSILTEETYSQRGLGRNEMVTVPTRTLFMATGNHLHVARDLRTRTLLCRLDTKEERPEQRAFAGDFRIQLQAQRPRIVAAGLTLMRAFIASKQKPADFVKPWGRFEQWSSMVRAPLVWMHQEDPCESLKTIENDDPVRSEQLQVMHLWHSCFGDKKLTARDVIGAVGTGVTDPEKELLQALRDIALDKFGALSAKRLGRWLERNKDAPAGGYQVELAEVKDHVNHWRVKKRTA